jgi:tetratricopeptide (TPR) repeat protein
MSSLFRLARATAVRNETRSLTALRSLAAAWPVVPARSFSTEDKQLSDAENEITKAILDLRAALDQGEYETAKQTAEDALQLCQNYYGEKAHPAVASAFVNLGLCNKHLGRYDEAEKAYSSALSIYKECVGLEHQSTAAAFLNLGLLQLSMAQRPTAKGLTKMDLVDTARMNLEQAHSIRAKCTSIDHPLTLTVSLHVAAAARMQKRYPEAENILKDTIAALRKRDQEAAGGPDVKVTLGSLSVATGVNNLGFLYKEMAVNSATGKKAAAESRSAVDLFALSAEAYQEALAIRERRLGPKHPDTIASLHNIAELRAAAGDDEGANKVRQIILERIGKGEGKETELK